MIGSTLEVLVPVKGRDTLASTVASLLDISRIDLITIISGDDPLSLSLSQTYSQRIRVIDHSDREFNKGVYLNAGIKAARGDILLVSDADILWKSDTIMQLWLEAASNADLVVWVAHVQESQPHVFAIHRPRLIPRLTHHNENQITLRVASEEGENTRPGCGLICTRRQNLLALGGYNEEFIGWGWEDWDLLIRSQILGYQLSSCGSVIHLSHPDSLRNQFNGNQKPLITRDHNILRSCQAIAQGNLQGGIVSKTLRKPPPYLLKVELPDELGQAFLGI